MEMMGGPDGVLVAGGGRAGCAAPAKQLNGHSNVRRGAGEGGRDFACEGGESRHLLYSAIRGRQNEVRIQRRQR
jgi:hypothetical protein